MASPSNLTTLCALIGITPEEANRLVKTQVLPGPSAGQYDLPRCVLAYCNHLRSGQGTAEDLGEWLNMTQIGVRKLVRESGMPRAKRGIYDLKVCVNWYIDRLRAKNRGEDVSDIAEETLLLKREQRLRAQLERETIERSKVDRVECEEGWVRLAGLFVAGLESLVPRLAALVPGIESPAEARVVIKREVGTLRDALANELDDIATGVREPHLGNGSPATRPNP